MQYDVFAAVTVFRKYNLQEKIKIINPWDPYSPLAHPK